MPLLCVHGWPETQADLVAGDRAAGGGRLRRDRPRPPRLRRQRPRTGRVPRRRRARRAICTRSSPTGSASTRWCCAAVTSAGPSSRRSRSSTRSSAERMVLFNSPLPFDKERMAGMDTRPPREAADYFVRQGLDADGLAADLTTPGAAAPLHRDLLLLTVLGPPGRVHGRRPDGVRTLRRHAEIDFHTEPFGDAGQAAGVLRRLRERVRPGQAERPRAPRSGTRTVRGAAPVRPVRPRDLPRRSTRWRPSSSPTTTDPIASTGAATSCRGRPPTRSWPTRPGSAPSWTLAASGR